PGSDSHPPPEPADACRRGAAKGTKRRVHDVPGAAFCGRSSAEEWEADPGCRRDGGGYSSVLMAMSPLAVCTVTGALPAPSVRRSECAPGRASLPSSGPWISPLEVCAETFAETE